MKLHSGTSGGPVAALLNRIEQHEVFMPLYKRLGLNAVVFDFDGTLADTPLDFMLLRKRAAAALAPFVSSPPDAGMQVLEMLACAAEGMEASLAAEAKAAVFAEIKATETEAARNGALFPFSRDLLRTLRGRGIACGVITRNCPEAVLTVFPDIREETDCLVTREDVENVKPHPEHLLHALRLLGCEPERTLMVGDHPMDTQTGRAAGALTAAVETGGTARERLAAEQPDFLLTNAGELLRVLEFIR